MLAPQLEPAPGEAVYLINRDCNPWAVIVCPYDPALHRDGLVTGQVARQIGNVTAAQWEILRDHQDSALS